MKKHLFSNKDVILENEKKKSEKTYFDKLFMKIFLSSFIVLLIVITNNLYLNKKINFNVINKINTNINAIKLLSLFNDSVFKFIENDVVDVYSSDVYDEVRYENNINYIKNYSLNYVRNLVSGYVVRIINDKAGYTIVIKGIDDLEYTFSGMKQINVKMYQYVDENTILGLTSYNEKTKTYEFILIIKEEDRYYSFYDKAN